MRELERDSLHDDPARYSGASGPPMLAIVGAGRVGKALIDALRDVPLELGHSRWKVAGPFGRGYDGGRADAVLLCVPDGRIRAAASMLKPGLLVGHCSGASRLDVLAPHEAFSLHPLLPVIPGQTKFEGAGAAIAGATARALAFAESLARALAMNPVVVAEEDRAAYHAAASIASNFLVTLESAAEQLAASAGVSRDLLVPLVRETVENWAALGAGRALTGPVMRGDEATIAAQRAAIAERAPLLMPLFEELVAATRLLAAQQRARPQEPALA